MLHTKNLVIRDIIIVIAAMITIFLAHTKLLMYAILLWLIVLILLELKAQKIEG